MRIIINHLNVSERQQDAIVLLEDAREQLKFLGVPSFFSQEGDLVIDIPSQGKTIISENFALVEKRAKGGITNIKLQYNSPVCSGCIIEITSNLNFQEFFGKINFETLRYFFQEKMNQESQNCLAHDTPLDQIRNMLLGYRHHEIKNILLPALHFLLTDASHHEQTREYLHSARQAVEKGWITRSEYVGILLQKTKKGRTPLHEALAYASLEELMSYFEELDYALKQYHITMRDYMSLLFEPNEHDRNPFNMAIKSGSAQKMKCYVQKIQRFGRFISYDQYAQFLWHPLYSQPLKNIFQGNQHAMLRSFFSLFRSICKISPEHKQGCINSLMECNENSALMRAVSVCTQEATLRLFLTELSDSLPPNEYGKILSILHNISQDARKSKILEEKIHAFNQNGETSRAKSAYSDAQLMKIRWEILHHARLEQKGGDSSRAYNRNMPGFSN